MKSDFGFCLSALPMLGEPGAVPPLTPSELLELIASCPEARPVVEALFLHDDLGQREGLAAGELTVTCPAVLTAEQVSMKSPLPEHLCCDPDRSIEADATWEAYFRFAAGEAITHTCEFLAGWVGFEVGLRNALAIARAGHLGLVADDHVVAVELGDPIEWFATVVSERAAAVTPLAELEMLIAARWAWVTEHEAWFSYSVDEFAAYATKLLLLIQYERLAEAADGRGSAKSRARAVGQPEEMTG